MDEREEIITIVFSILGFIVLIISICLIICFYYRSKSMKHRQQYQRSQKNLSTMNAIHNKRKRRKRRFNTNESTISFSFNPPHLINQNVKNLDQLIPIESPENLSNPSTEPIYTSASSLSNFTLALQMYPHTSHLNNLHFQFLNELNHILCLKHEQRPSNILKYSQSYRQQNDSLPFDYYRSITPSSISGSNQYLFESNPRRTTLTQFRDDTAIWY